MAVCERWDKFDNQQRPELWNLYNAQLRNGETMRVFPLSNWTEADVGQYILEEQVPVVPLYFAAERPVVKRVGVGMIRFGLRRAENVHWQALDIDRSIRARQKGQKAFCLWFTGLSGAGKSTLANALDRQNFTGIGSAYEPPENAELRLQAGSSSSRFSSMN